MFEQATLTSGPSGKRVWTTFLGLTSQAALIVLAMLAPMVWPQAMPAFRLWESLAAPPPPGPPKLGEKLKKEPAGVRPVRFAPWSIDKFAPNRVPDRVYTVVDEPPAAPWVVGSPSGLDAGPGDGVVGSILSNMARNAVRLPEPVAPLKPAAKTAPDPTPPVIQRYTQGGNVRLGQPLFRGEPLYPANARAAHITGDVKLECVVGIDGHIHEVKVLSGNPFLVRAAVEAAWKWVYSPSQLNGVPIEIVTVLTFSFKLN